MLEQIQIFSNKECKEIITKYSNSDDWVTGKVKTTKPKLSSGRIVRELPILHDNFIAESIYKHTHQLGPLRELILLKYSTGGKYNRHKDSTLLNGRIFSFSIPLNIGNFTGGEFFLEDKLIKLKTGRAFIFKSSEYHGVKPVIDGTRFAIVGWIHKNSTQKSSII